MKSLFSFLFVVQCFFAGIALAQPTGFIGYQLPVAADDASLKNRVFAYEDTSRTATLADVMAPATQAKFDLLQTTSSDFGYTQSVIWLRFDVRNTNTQNTDWRLHFRENFLQLLEVYQITTDGTVKLLEKHDTTSPFSDRDIAYPELVVGFALPPQDSSTFYVRYWSGGSSQLTFTLRDKVEFEALATRKTAKNFIFYGMLMLLIGVSFAAYVATRRPVFAAYCAYVTFGLLFVMHGDGNAFRYLWPNMPLFNGYSSILLGSGIIIFGATFARLFINTAKYNPIMDKILLALIAITLVMIASTIIIDTQTVKKYLILVSLVAMVLFMVSGLVAARTRFKEVRFYVIAWAGAAISSAIMTSRHWLGLEISEEVQFDSMRIVIVSDAALMGFAILDRINQLRRAQKDALEFNLHEAQRTLRMSSRLQELENQYALALKIAQSKDRKIADTIHDIRQPLHALRLKVSGLVDSTQTSTDATQIEDTFSYLENLVSEELGAASQQESLAALDLDTADTETPSKTHVQDILQTTHEMFKPDADLKGITLECTASDETTILPPLDLMRLVTNLVSNAVKYTDQGHVQFGCDTQNGIFGLFVNDTGQGLTPDQFDQMLARHERGDQTTQAEGYGLGLAIVKDICDKHGLTPTVQNPAGSGTRIFVPLPQGPQS